MGRLLASLGWLFERIGQVKLAAQAYRSAQTLVDTNNDSATYHTTGHRLEAITNPLIEGATFRCGMVLTAIGCKEWSTAAKQLNLARSIFTVLGISKELVVVIDGINARNREKAKDAVHSLLKRLESKCTQSC